MKVLSSRKIHNGKMVFADIIYEWEDILSRQLEIPLLDRSESEVSFDKKCRNLYKKTKIPFYRLYSILDKRGKNIFMFDIGTKKQDGIYNAPNYIPCLIDYFFTDDEYTKFIRAYNRNSLVLVSSREVYEYLINKNCSIPIEHFPLSIADNYWQDEPFEKKYDLVMFGRQNPLLIKYINRYEKMHSDFRLVRRKNENGHFIYYLSSTGETVSICDTREEYMKLVSQSKVAVYATPGMDESRLGANGWNQVTPHFLEGIAGQCHIIARYPDNADTQWYEISKLCKSVETYEEFEELMDKYIREVVDLKFYNEYLKKHFTSRRVEMLKDIIEKYQLY